MKIRLQEYLREGGACPYQEWFDSLDAQAIALNEEYKARKKALLPAKKGKTP